jgi:hypothetical protein
MMSYDCVCGLSWSILGGRAMTSIPFRLGDRELLRMQPGEMTAVKALPGDPASAFILQIAMRYVEDLGVAVFASNRWSYDEVEARIIALHLEKEIAEVHSMRGPGADLSQFLARAPRIVASSMFSPEAVELAIE